jgi:hypothetical protein
MAAAPQENGSDGKGLLQVATEIAGLFAGLAALVYATGAIVMALRLAFKGLPWNNVVSQLPREFMLSVGAGQVLLPALLVGALYGLYRLIWADRPTPPRTVSFRRNGWRARGIVLRRYAIGALLLLAPTVLIVASRDDVGFGDLKLGLVLGIFLVVGVAAAAVQEARALVIKRFDDPEQWNSLRPVAAMAGVYAVAALPAALLGAAAIPLTEANVCITGGYSETGYLVGESSDRVYLGEKPKGKNDGGQRRILVVPLAKVEELFFGDEAYSAGCEFPPPGATGSDGGGEGRQTGGVGAP